MVQLRASLEALVLQAWRDRWSELEWSIHLKQVLASDDGELNKLCGLLLRQATLSEVPNKLMFTYLNFTVAAQVVSHSSLLEAIVEYRDFGREQCIEAILEQLNQSRDKLRCESREAYECERLCELLSRLMGWLMDGMEHSLVVNDEQLLNELLITALPYLTSPFVALCLYFDALNHLDICQLQIERASDLCSKVVACPSMPDIIKNEMIAFHRKLSSIPVFHSNAPISPLHDCREISPGNPQPHPAIITLSAVYGSFRVTKRHEEVANMLKAAQSALGLPWWLVMSDLVRGALLIQLDPGAAARDSTITAFVYLKIPRILKEFMDDGVPHTELVRALEHVVAYHSLLNSLDGKTKFNCYSNLLDQLKATGLLNDDHFNHLLDLRSRERTGLIETQPQNQQGIQLVLRAEGTVTTLERSFNNENALNPQKLVQMMSHMILSGGKSFDYICASSAATGRLARFAGKLALFNINSERSGKDNEHGKIRATMFDLSFLLLSRIRCLYPDLRLTDLVGAGDDTAGRCFFKWSSTFADSVDSLRDPEPPVSATDKTNFMDEFNKLKREEAYWTVEDCDWALTISKIPVIGELLLDEYRENKIKDNEDTKNVFMTLNKDVSALLLCLVQWLHVQPSSTARTALMHSLEHFFETFLPQVEEGQQQYRTEERWRFMVATSRPTMDLMLAGEQLRGPPYTWLIHCARRQLPSVTRFQVPDLDALKQAFTYALRQNWAGPNVLALVDRCNKAGEHRMWCTVWIGSLLKLSTADEIGAATELCLSVAMLTPRRALVTFVKLVADYVLDGGNELFCVPPRGVILAQFLVQALLLAVHVQMMRSKSDGVLDDGPTKAKKCRVEQGDKDSVDKATTSARCEETKEPTITGEDAVKALFTRFSQVTADGELKPAASFVVSFLRSLSELKSPAAKRIISLLPHSLLLQVIQTDPKSIPPSVILSLFNLDEQPHKRRALQNICLLRELRAV